MTGKWINFKKQNHIQYPKIDFAVTPTHISDVLPMPESPVNSFSIDGIPFCNHESETEVDYIPLQKYLMPHMITQPELRDTVRDYKIFASNARISVYHDRHKDIRF